jgi:hypothetical protein
MQQYNTNGQRTARCPSLTLLLIPALIMTTELTFRSR